MNADNTGVAAITGPRKAAALLVALGSELASSVLKALDEATVEVIAREIVRMQQLPAEVRDVIMQSVYEDAMSRQFITVGGSDYARDLLARTLGTQRAGEVLTRASTTRRDQPFSFMAELDATQVVPILEQEHPQTAAVVLANLAPDFAGRLMAGLDFESQSDIAGRIATMGRISPDTVKEVEAAMKKRVATLQTQGFKPQGGVEYLVKVLNGMDTRSEQNILAALEHNDPELASEVRKHMFVFEDVKNLDDRSIQRLLRDVNQNDLTIALRNSSGELQTKILKNVSSRTAQTIKDNMAIGPVRLRLVEEAQQRIINIVRTLQDAEEIVVTKGDQDVLV